MITLFGESQILKIKPIKKQHFYIIKNLFLWCVSVWIMHFQVQIVFDVSGRKLYSLSHLNRQGIGNAIYSFRNFIILEDLIACDLIIWLFSTLLLTYYSYFLYKENFCCYKWILRKVFATSLRNNLTKQVPWKVLFGSINWP